MNLIGKATQTPVYRLLAQDGDFQPHGIRTYASGGLYYNEGLVVDHGTLYVASTGNNRNMGISWGTSFLMGFSPPEFVTRERGMGGDRAPSSLGNASIG